MPEGPTPPTSALRISDPVPEATPKPLSDESRRLRESYEAIGRFSAGVAHDFNTVFGVITGYGELALGQLEPEHPARPHVEEMLAAARRAANVTRQLLAFSRKQVLRPREVDAAALVAELAPALRALLGERIALDVRAESDLGTVRVDPGQLRQALLNLADNAREAMPGGGTVTIEIANRDLAADYAATHPPVEPGPFVMIAVSDTGRGMDDGVRARCFEPFFSTKPEGGAGLGLSTAYGIVKQSGGFLWAYSEPGRGTTLKVYLPCITPAPPVESAPAEAPPVPRPRLLVVDDLEPLRKLLRHSLEREGYEVLEAADGEQALELARASEAPIALLLTDVVLPKLNGVELARAVCELAPGTPVLFMSGFTSGAAERIGELPPGADLLEKPFSYSTLSKSVRRALASPSPS